MIPYKWKVAPEVTGLMSIAYRRQWPSAQTPTGAPICSIDCEDSYSAQRALNGAHGELTVRIRFASETPAQRERYGSFQWRSLNRKFTRLSDAKRAFDNWYRAHPNHNFGL